MAKRKDPSPLFEIIHNAGRPSEPNVRIPEWLRKQQEQAAPGGQGEESRPAEAESASEPPAEQRTEGDHPDHAREPDPQPAADASEPAQEPDSPPQAVTEPQSVSPAPDAPADPATEPAGEPVEPRQHSASGAAGSAEPTRSRRGEAGRWLSQPIVLRVPRSRALLLAAAGVALIGAAFGTGWLAGQSQAEQRRQSYENLVQSLQESVEPGEKGLIPSSVRGVEAQTAGASATSSGAVLDSDDDPREPGLNYFRLVTMPGNARASGERAVRFLRRNGVDAALVPIKNNNSLKLIALRGFESPNSDPAARQFKRRLQSLGREWKAQHRGSSDWEDLYPEKYRPGEN